MQQLLLFTAYDRRAFYILQTISKQENAIGRAMRVDNIHYYRLLCSF